MTTQTVPHRQWAKFLQTFSQRHQGWLVSIQTHDLKTGETVASRFMPLHAAELDLEDEKNPRINVTVGSAEHQVKHVLFRPSELALEMEHDNDKAIRIVSLNTVTTVRFRVAAPVELVDGVA